jgi:hypothetical protein
MPPWSTFGFKLFVSHVFEERVYATSLKGQLEYFGIDAFVAHSDIKPSHQWLEVIKESLRTCDAFLALLHDEFRKSAWCDQEVGYALACDRIFVPGRFDNSAPHGFLQQYQALRLDPDGTLKANAIAVRDTLLRGAPSTAARLTDAIVHRVVESDSFEQTNELMGVLLTQAGHITEAHVKLLELCRKENAQVAGAWHAEGRIKRLREIVDSR